ncbi:hypothetical protein NPX79_03220 [Spiroplasma endosymbiont of Anurida maritima]|uniref:hypothetical protein n=1 Tax=Spiroplasma endosymbiont of Anurida maritima TaxID=2967972 RepID=UPI0036D26673
MIEASFIVWFVLTPVDNFYYIGGLNPIFFINFIGPLFLLTGSIFWLVFLTDILKLNNRIQNSLNSKTSPHIVRDDYGVGEINHREQTRTSINFDDNSNIDLKQKVAKLKAMMGNAPDDNYLRTVDKDTREVVHENPSAAFIEKTNDIKEPVPTQPVTYKDKIDSVKVLDKEHKIFIPSSRKDTDFDTSSIAKKLNQNPLYGGSYNSQTKQSNYKNKTNNNNSSFVGDGDKIWEANQQYRNQYVSKEKVYKNNDDENRNN